MQEQVLELRTESLGKGHPATLASMHNLATSIQRQGRYEEAAPLLVRNGCRPRGLSWLPCLSIVTFTRSTTCSKETELGFLQFSYCWFLDF